MPGKRPGTSRSGASPRNSSGIRNLSRRRRSTSAPAEPLHRYRGRSPAGCRRYRKYKRETSGSRRLRPFPFREARNTPPAFRTDHVLGMIFGIFSAVQLPRREGFALDQRQHLRAIQDFTFQQHFGDLHHGFGMLVDNRRRGIVPALYQPLHLLIDADSGLFAVIAMLRDLTSEEDLLFLLAEAQR